MIDLKGNPFFLTEEQIQWVEDTLSSMTLAEKLGQVFCPIARSRGGGVPHMVKELGVGGIMSRPGKMEDIRDFNLSIQRMAKIPLLIAANAESGGDGVAFEGTSFGQPMAVAATGDPEDAYRMGYTACAEGAALGMNWAFAPIVDIDLDFHNPITNTRTFGSNAETVATCGARYLDAADENGVAVSIKHFPGDGVDERDQHLVTSINSLGADEWMRSYGKIYRSLIARGAKTVMVGHIAQPAWSEKLNPDGNNKYHLLPASLNQALLSGLLRQELAFNGLIVTDATPMLGFTTAMPRSLAIPAAIAAGVDMILFNKDLEEDIAFLRKGLEDGIFTQNRLDEAVCRILATKAALHLPEKKAEGSLVPGKEAMLCVGCKQHKAWAKDTADSAITLVRDRQNLLPISPQKYHRVYLNVIQQDQNPMNATAQLWKQLFEESGFEVILRDRSVSVTATELRPDSLSPDKENYITELYRSIEDVKRDYDLYVYVVNMQVASNQTTLRLNWHFTFGLGDDAPWMCREIPVMMISTASPYHLFDAPMVDTYINAYSGIPIFCEAVMEKITGKSRFRGISPVDPYCGNEYLKI